MKTITLKEALDTYDYLYCDDTEDFIHIDDFRAKVKRSTLEELREKAELKYVTDLRIYGTKGKLLTLDADHLVSLSLESEWPECAGEIYLRMIWPGCNTH